MSRALIQEIRLPEARAGWPYEATSVGGVLDKVAFYIVTIGYMLKRDDIVEGVILSRRTNDTESRKTLLVSFIKSAQTGLENGYYYCGTWITLAGHAGSRIHWEV